MKSILMWTLNVATSSVCVIECSQMWHKCKKTQQFKHGVRSQITGLKLQKSFWSSVILNYSTIWFLTPTLSKNYSITSVLCLYVCLFAIIKTRSSNFPELLMMMPVARSTASQVGGDAENARPENDGQTFSKLWAQLRGLENAGLENDGQTCGHSRFSALCAAKWLSAVSYTYWHG